MDRLAEMIRAAQRLDGVRLFGAIVLTAGIFLVDLRQQDEWGSLLRLLVAAIPCVALYLVALSVARPGEPLQPWQSTLMLCGVALALLSLLQLADLLGGDGGESSGTLFWVFGLLTAATAYLAYTVRSPIHLLLATLALAISFLSFVDWAIDDLSLDTTRDLLLALSLLYCAIGYRLQMVAGAEGADYTNYAVLTASLAAVLAGTIGVGTETLGGFLASIFFQENSTFWELVLLVVSLASIAYTVVTGYRATAYSGLFGLVVFVSALAVDGGVWAWPLLLVIAGAACVAGSIWGVRLLERAAADRSDS